MLADIRIRFIARMEKALACIEECARQSHEAPSATLRMEAHKLAGVAATLGFERVGNAAAKVDAIEGIAPDHHAVADLVTALQDALSDRPSR